MSLIVSNSIRLLALAALSLPFGITAWGADNHFRPPKNAALIANTGSTNTTGYRIYIQPTGYAQYEITGRVSTTAGDTMTSGHVPTAQAKKLFHDLAAALPLAQLPRGFGMKSASFGTSTYVEYKGQRSPDLSFTNDPRGRALHDDAVAIANSLHLENMPRRMVQPVTPSTPGH